MRQEIGKYLVRDLVMGDAPAIAKYANNRKIWINLYDTFPHPYSLGDAEYFLSRVVKASPQNVFGICADGEAIGTIALMVGKDVHRFTAELGYWLAEPFWGCGITTMAVDLLVDYGFSALGLKRIHANPFCTNPASFRVLEKAGFNREGILHANVFKDGEFIDQVVYAKTTKVTA